MFLFVVVDHRTAIPPNGRIALHTRLPQLPVVQPAPCRTPTQKKMPMPLPSSLSSGHISAVIKWRRPASSPYSSLIQSCIESRTLIDLASILLFHRCRERQGKAEAQMIIPDRDDVVIVVLIHVSFLSIIVGSYLCTYLRPNGLRSN